jgi:4-amino-4-deoxy-L-arabinose transferase-like glycosyltransferase
LSDAESSSIRWWQILCLAALAFVALTMTYWSLRHKQPIQWDENEYLNVNYRDLITKHHGGWPAYFSSLVQTYPYRPPAYRLMAIPVTLTIGPKLLVLRAIGVLAFLASAWLMYRAVAIASDRRAGLLAAMLFGCSLGMIDACRWYGTESTSYLAIAGSMWCMFRLVRDPRAPHRWWIGLGVAIGVGLLSKMSFPWIVGPMYGVILIAAIAKQVPWRTIGKLALAGVVALLVAGPWYLANFDKYVEYARISQKWDRKAIGDTTGQIVVNWLNGIYVRGFGPVLTIAIILAVCAALVKRSRQPKMLLLICLAASLPFPMAQLLFSVNHSVRVITPAFVPAIAGVAILVAGLLRHRAAIGVVTAVIVLQLALVVWPWNRTYYALWDLRPMVKLAGLENRPRPNIAFAGLHADFDVEGVATPFLERGVEPKVAVLWSSGQPLDLAAIRAKAIAADAVLVVPDYDGTDMAAFKFDRENVHNREIDQWLRDSGDFQPPRTFVVGDQPAYTVNVYLPKASQ